MKNTPVVVFSISAYHVRPVGPSMDAVIVGVSDEELAFVVISCCKFFTKLGGIFCVWNKMVMKDHENVCVI